MIGQTTNQANNPPKDGTILPPTIDVDKHELTEQELADMTPMRLAERIQQMEEAFKCLEKWLFAGKDVLTLDEASVFLDASKSQLYKLTRTFAIPHYKPNGKTIYFSKEELVEWIKKHPVKTKEVYEQDAIRYVMNKPLKSR